MTCPEVAVPLSLASVVRKVVVGPAAAAIGVGLQNMAALVQLTVTSVKTSYLSERVLMELNAGVLTREVVLPCVG